MNRVQAKARAAELGITKDVARQHGNLNKTQTWLDAISAHEVQMQTQEAAEVQPASDLPPAECEVPVIDGQPMQIDAVIPETHTAILEEACAVIPEEACFAIATEQSVPDESLAIPLEVCAEIATEQLCSDESAPMCADPWDEADETVALPEMLYSTESRLMYSVSEAAASAKSEMPDSGSNLQLPALEPSKAPGETTDAFAPVYPLLLFYVAVWVLLWATVKLLVGLGLCLKLGLTYLVKQINSAMNEGQESAQQKGSGIEKALVRSPRPSCTAIP